MSSSIWAHLAEELAVAGCRAVFGVPTDEPGLLDAAKEHPALVAVAVRDQRTGACVAAGYAMTSGSPVALAVSSGPAFLNSLAGVSEAASVGAPLILVSTRIPAAGVGRGGFQDTDQLAVAAPLVGWRYQVEQPEQLAWAARRAVRLSTAQLPSVCLVEVTDEVLRGHAVLPAKVAGARAPWVTRTLRAEPAEDSLRQAADVMHSARRPLVVIGGGCRGSIAWPTVKTLAENWGAAVATTAAGRPVADETHPMACGVVGLYATPPLDEVFNAADVVLGVGTRWEETATMGWPGLAAARVVHVDRDVAAFDQSVPAEVALLGDAS